MTFVGFLIFAFQCFNSLAWPLCSLGYPLCASVRAIELNSSKDIQNLVTYWVSFSLISLFDHAFAKLLYWNPLWPYIKLLAICWLVIPNFDGSLYVYKHVVHTCVSETPVLVMNWLTAWKVTFLSKEEFLVAAEKYIEENGAEALEKLIANKIKCGKLKNTAKEVKGVDTTDENADLLERKEPNDAPNEIKQVEGTEKRDETATKWVNKSELSLSDPDNKTKDAAISGESITLAVENIKLSTVKMVQKEWACTLCQVKTTSENILNDHLRGKKHRAKCEEQKAKEAADNQGSSASMTTQSTHPKMATNNLPSFETQILPSLPQIRMKVSPPTSPGWKMDVSKIYDLATYTSTR